MVKKVGKYELGKSLGEGTFGKVKYAIDTETNEAVAIKILDKEKIQKQNMGNQIKKEISIMKVVKHKNIVGMIEVLASKTKIFIVLELITGGELFDKIVQVGKLDENQARFYFQQLIEGVEYCHKLGICHRDLKPENLLLDEHGNLKISDFGLSSLYVGDENEGTLRTELLHTTCGTPNYVAPEVLSDQGYDGKKADVWSCGVILYVLLAGFLPFDESTIVALFAKIQNADFTYPTWFSAEVRSLLDQILVADPKIRINITNIKLHPWYIGPAAATRVLSTEAPAAMPTVDQMEDAVKSVGGDHKHYSEDINGKDEDFDDNDAFPNISSPVTLNAFDLVSQCGGFMLDKMFSPEIFYGLPAEEISGTQANKSYAHLGGSILFGTAQPKSKCFHYTAANINPHELATLIYNAMESMGFDFEDKKERIIQTGVFRTTILSAKGMLGMFLQIFVLTPSLNLLEIRKGKGDILEWKTAFTELVEKKIGHVLNRLKEPDGDAKEYY